jgi:hypothetical protein
LEEVAEHAGLRVLVEVDDTFALIFGQSTTDLGPAAQASHSALIKHYYFITYLFTYYYC